MDRTIAIADKYTLPARNVCAPGSGTPRPVATWNVRAATKYTNTLAGTTSSAPIQLYRLCTALALRFSSYDQKYCIKSRKGVFHGIGAGKKREKTGRGKPVLIMHIGFFACFISRTQSFQQTRHIIFHALVALKLLVTLLSRLVACSARIVVYRQTNRHTDQVQ